MPKMVTMKIDDETYNLLTILALQENRPLENFIETAALRYIEENGLVDEFEMAEICSNDKLRNSLQRGASDYNAGRGSFV
jgi:hypothetical protein